MMEELGNFKKNAKKDFYPFNRYRFLIKYSIRKRGNK